MRRLATERAPRRSNDLDVLLRHRSPSIPSAGGSSDASARIRALRLPALAVDAQAARADTRAAAFLERTFLDEALGGSTGLLYVDEVELSLNQVLLPNRDAREPELDLGAAARYTATSEDHIERDPATEIEDLLDLGVELLVGGHHVLHHATRRPLAFELAALPSSKSAIGGVEGFHGVEITAIRGLDEAAYKRHQVGVRGLLRHHPGSIP